MSEGSPATIGGYRIVSELGKGGMATVYLAMAQGKARFRKLIAVKVLNKSHASNAEFLEMFLTEARLAAQLNHANVVNTYEIGEDQGMHFIAMEYLEGQSYSAIVKRVGRGKLALEHHLKVLVDTLAALHYAHELVDLDGTRLNLVHRDVSPQNIFVTYEGVVKLVDFGIAKAACSDNETKAGVIKGKIAYLAPEQALCQPVDRRADIFSVGVMLWEALSERRFAAGTLDVATIHNRVTGGEPRIRDVAPDVPRDLAAICDKAIALKPNDRYSTAEAFRIALDSALDFRAQRHTSQSLATLVGDIFTDERSSVRMVIEHHAKTADSNPGVIVPRLVMASDSGEVSSPSAASNSTIQFTGVGATAPLVPSGSQSRLLLGISGGALIIATIATTVLVMSRHESASLPTSQPSLSSPSASSSSSSAALPAVKTVELVVTVFPEEGQVFVDGVLVSGNPVRAKVDRDGKMHVVRAVAPGYETSEQSSTFDADSTLKIVLRKAAELVSTSRLPKPDNGAAAASPRKADAATTSSAGDDLRNARSRDKSNRTVDDKDPYAK